MKSYIRNSIIIILSIILLDQLTKYLARLFLEFSEPKIIIENIFHLTLKKNTGAAFSILQENNFLLLIAGIIITIGLFYYLSQTEKTEVLPIAFIIGGAVGNLIDRAWHEGVIDFIQISIWPVFNIADMAISIGVLLLVITIIQKNK